MNFRELISLETPQEPMNESSLTEAKFSAKNIEKVVKLYSKIMGKRMGGEFKPLGFEDYTRKTGPGKGFRVINNSGTMLRFNWDVKQAKQALYELTSMDYWADNNKNFELPTRTVRFAPELNVVQVLDKVIDALLTGTIRESNALFDEVNLVLEGRSKEERLKWAEDNGLPPTSARSDKYLRIYGDKNGISEQVEVFLGSKESNSFEGELKRVEKAFDKEVYADPDTVFEDIEDLVGVVASGKWRTLIVCGQGGVGKCLQGEQSVNIRGLVKHTSKESTQMKDIFDHISDLENHTFELNKQYKNKTLFQIETMNGYVNVVAMMLKEDIGVSIKSNGSDLLVSKLHRISTPNGIEYVRDLSAGDKLSHKDGDKTIDAITETDTVIVYDLTVDSEDHLFLDSNGFIHHNTHHITEGDRSLKALLGAEGNKWTYHSGVKASPLAFYRTLFQERDKIIVFDEADAVLKHSEIVMMLKPILDTSGGNLAEYLTGTMNMVGKTADQIDEYSKMVGLALQQGASLTKAPSKRLWDPLTDDLEPNMTEYDVMLPSKFHFTGGMIFISNMKAAQIEAAIMSRSIFVDVYLAEQDVLKRCKSIGYKIADKNKSTTRSDIDDVLEALGDDGAGEEVEITYMTPEYARKSKQVTVRALQLGLILKETGLSRWKDLVALYA